MKIYTELNYKTSDIFINMTEFEIKWKDDNPKLLFFLGMNFQFLLSIENLKTFKMKNYELYILKEDNDLFFEALVAENVYMAQVPNNKVEYTEIIWRYIVEANNEFSIFLLGARFQDLKTASLIKKTFLEND
jgi:hypothetical protein